MSDKTGNTFLLIPRCHQNSMNLSIHLAQMTFFGNLFLRSPRWQHHKYKKLTELNYTPPVLWFIPEMERLFLASPSLRRNFFDRLIYGIDKNEFILLW